MADGVSLTDVVFGVDFDVVDFVCVHAVLQSELVVPHCLQQLETLGVLQDVGCDVQPDCLCHLFLFYSIAIDNRRKIFFYLILLLIVRLNLLIKFA